jgi:hypothetical protein
MAHQRERLVLEMDDGIPGTLRTRTATSSFGE